MNISEFLLKNNFALCDMPEKSKKTFSPKNNWFGLSTYCPDASFKNGNKKVILSLQGVSCSFAEYKEEHKELWDTMSIKYVCFKNDEKIVYEDYTGIMPNEEFIKDFVK